MYKLNITGYIISSVFRVLVLVGGYLGNVPMMFICLAISTLGMGPLQGDINVIITVLLCFLKVEKANKDLDAKAKETIEETVNA